jgi:hypothetical protein
MKHLITLLMKRSILPLICTSIPVMFSACGDDAGKTAHEKTEAARNQGSIKNSTLEELSASVVIALRNNDPGKLEELVPAKEDFEKIVSVYSGSEDDKKMILAGSEENSRKILANTTQAVDEIRRKGADAGINWEEATFSNAEYEVKKENNIETADLKVIVSYKDLKYKIKIAECIKTDRGWLIFDKPEWGG